MKSRAICLPCFKLKRKIINKKYNDGHREQKNANNREFYDLNKESELNRKKNYYKNNKEKVKKRNLKWKFSNKEKINEASKIARQDPKNKIRKRELGKLYYHKNKLRKIIKSVINQALKGKKNGKSITKYLNYTIQDLNKHINDQFESWMNWNNHGIYNSKNWNDNDASTWTWQLDHIIPHSTFKYVSMEDQEFKDCWALSNLRPYSAKQNVLDGSNRSRHL